MLTKQLIPARLNLSVSRSKVPSPQKKTSKKPQNAGCPIGIHAFCTKHIKKPKRNSLIYKGFF
jgi:hypothetical protein